MGFFLQIRTAVAVVLGHAKRLGCADAALHIRSEYVARVASGRIREALLGARAELCEVRVGKDCR